MRGALLSAWRRTCCVRRAAYACVVVGRTPRSLGSTGRELSAPGHHRALTTGSDFMPDPWAADRVPRSPNPSNKRKAGERRCGKLPCTTRRPSPRRCTATAGSSRPRRQTIDCRDEGSTCPLPGHIGHPWRTPYLSSDADRSTGHVAAAHHSFDGPVARSSTGDRGRLADPC